AVRDVARACMAALGLFQIAPLRQHDGALVEERIGNRNGLSQQDTGLSAPVNDVALELLDSVHLQLTHTLHEVLMALLVDGGDLHVANLIVRLEPRLHGVDADDIARDRYVERLVATFAHYGELYRRVDRAAHLFDSLLERQPDDLLIVEMRDQVVGLDACPLSRRAVDGCDHLDHAVLHRDLDAEAAELTPRLHLHVAEMLRAEISRMRVERRQHAVDRRLDELGVVRLLDIVGTNALQHVAEQVELPVNLRIRR